MSLCYGLSMRVLLDILLLPSSGGNRRMRTCYCDSSCKIVGYIGYHVKVASQNGSDALQVLTVFSVPHTLHSIYMNFT